MHQQKQNLKHDGAYNSELQRTQFNFSDNQHSFDVLLLVNHTEEAAEEVQTVTRIHDLPEQEKTGNVQECVYIDLYKKAIIDRKIVGRTVAFIFVTKSNQRRSLPVHLGRLTKQERYVEPKTK